MRGRIVRLLRRHDIDLEGRFDDGQTDPLWLESPVLAQVQGASVLGRVATGPRAGHRVLRLGNDPTAPVVITGGPRQAHLEGFDLQAATVVPADQRDRLEHLARYVLRPPVAQDALELTGDGKVLLHLRRPWRDGTRAICFEPVEFLEKLCVLVPRPRTNLLIYHGAFAPRGRGRSELGIETDAAASGSVNNPGGADLGGRPASAKGSADRPRGAREAGGGAQPYVRPRYFAWAELLWRIFGEDILACYED